MCRYFIQKSGSKITCIISDDRRQSDIEGKDCSSKSSEGMKPLDRLVTLFPKLKDNFKSAFLKADSRSTLLSMCTYTHHGAFKQVTHIYARIPAWGLRQGRPSLKARKHQQESVVIVQKITLVVELWSLWYLMDTI